MSKLETKMNKTTQQDQVERERERERERKKN